MEISTLGFSQKVYYHNYYIYKHFYITRGLQTPDSLFWRCLIFNDLKYNFDINFTHSFHLAEIIRELTKGKDFSAYVMKLFPLTYCPKKQTKK